MKNYIGPLFVAGVIIFLFISLQPYVCKEEPRIIRDTVYVVDTVTIPPITIIKKGYIHDTVFVDKDTLSQDFVNWLASPFLVQDTTDRYIAEIEVTPLEKLVALQIDFKPQVDTVTVFVTEVRYEEPTFLEKAQYALIGVGIGALAVLIIN